MGVFESAIARVAPGLALKRQQSRMQLQVLMNYDAATTGRRGSSWSRSRGDADSAAGFGRRSRMAAVSHDMIRNTPFATSGKRVIVGSVVGDGIIPKLTVAGDDDLQKEGRKLIADHCDTTAIDHDGRQNLYGLQELALGTCIDAGEALIVRRHLPLVTTFPLPFQLQVLEPDFLDETRDGVFSDGKEIRDGIEYDASGVRVAYWLYQRHPGAVAGGPVRLGLQSLRVPAADVIHLFRQDRAGQMRGVTWFANVAMKLQDLADVEDAHQMRQKIAACFAGFRENSEARPADAQPFPKTVQPGAIMDLYENEKITFGDPPTVGDLDPFTKLILRAVASGLGITYEALTGDLTGVNFTSGRMGRQTQNTNVSGWQWKLMIPTMMHPIGGWFKEGWVQIKPEKVKQIRNASMTWTPPMPVLVDPTREIPALIKKVRGGLDSRQNAIRQLGHDPEVVHKELLEDAAVADQHGFVLDSDPRRVSNSGATHARPVGSDFPTDEENDDE